MGNHSSSSTPPPPSPAVAKVMAPVCDTTCQKDKEIAQTQAAWQKISSDPTADPSARQAAYQAYMVALHGQAWVFQQQQAKEAKLVSENTVDNSRLSNIQQRITGLNTDIAALEAESSTLDGSIEKLNEEMQVLHAKILLGQQYARQLRRVLDLSSRSGANP
jgi:chromosome segregation ATPase